MCKKSSLGFCTPRFRTSLLVCLLGMPSSPAARRAVTSSRPMGRRNYRRIPFGSHRAPPSVRHTNTRLRS